MYENITRKLPGEKCELGLRVIELVQGPIYYPELVGKSHDKWIVTIFMKRRYDFHCMAWDVFLGDHSNVHSIYKGNSGDHTI